LLSYWSTYAAASSTVSYCGVVLEGRELLAMPEGTVPFDSRLMSADEAVRQHLGRFIDDTAFGGGTAPEPSWTDYRPYK
jgi:hypothetical protein